MSKKNDLRLQKSHKNEIKSFFFFHFQISHSLSYSLCKRVTYYFCCCKFRLMFHRKLNLKLK